MAEENAGETVAALSDVQRIEQLEAKSRFQLILLIVLGAMTVILLTMVITAIFVLPGSADESAAGASGTLAAMSGTIKEHEVAIRKMEESLARMEEVQATYVETMDRMGVIDRTRQTEEMLAILLQQHADYREVVNVLRNGMTDLSRMIPGSRTWLLEYTERLDRGLAATSDRERQLLKFQKSLQKPEGEMPPEQ